MRFVSVGHVTNDRLATGLVAGGSVVYAALAARALGHQAKILTSHGPDFVGVRLLADAGVAVENTPSPTTTCFENLYEGGARRQRVTDVARPIAAGDVDADVVLVCPVIDEIAGPATTTALVGAGLQGWLRAVDGDRVRRRLPTDLGFLEGVSVAFLSVEDVGPDRDLLAGVRARVPTVILTDGANGATLFTRDGDRSIPADPAREVDPTGAGDTFATTFLLALAEGRSLDDAADRAACAGAIAVEAIGPGAAAGLSDLERRVAQRVVRRR